MTPVPALRPRDETPRPAHPDAAPTVRQIYALAAELCERLGEEFPETRLTASETIERLRIENGHPAPHLEEPWRGTHGRGRRERGRPYAWWRHLDRA